MDVLFCEGPGSTFLFKVSLNRSTHLSAQHARALTTMLIHPGAGCLAVGGSERAAAASRLGS
jgi:hypothetical protein